MITILLTDFFLFCYISNYSYRPKSLVNLNNSLSHEENALKTKKIDKSPENVLILKFVKKCKIKITF